MPSSCTAVRSTWEVDADQAVLQVLAEPVVDGEGDQQGGNPGGHPGDGDAGACAANSWRRLARR